MNDNSPNKTNQRNSNNSSMMESIHHSPSASGASIISSNSNRHAIVEPIDSPLHAAAVITALRTRSMSVKRYQVSAPLPTQSLHLFDTLVNEQAQIVAAQRRDQLSNPFDIEIALDGTAEASSPNSPSSFTLALQNQQRVKGLGAAEFSYGRVVHKLGELPLKHPPPPSPAAYMSSSSSSSSVHVQRKGNLNADDDDALSSEDDEDDYERDKKGKGSGKSGSGGGAVKLSSGYPSNRPHTLVTSKGGGTGASVTMMQYDYEEDEDEELMQGFVAPRIGAAAVVAAAAAGRSSFNNSLSVPSSSSYDHGNGNNQSHSGMISSSHSISMADNSIASSTTATSYVDGGKQKGFSLSGQSKTFQGIKDLR